jgi:hypothetical protein
VDCASWFRCKPDVAGARGYAESARRSPGLTLLPRGPQRCLRSDSSAVSLGFTSVNKVAARLTTRRRRRGSQLGLPYCLAPTLLVGAVYGMHSNHMPELHRLLRYPLALVLMLVSTVALHAKEASSFPDQKRDRAAPSRSGLYRRESEAGCAGQRARHSSTSEPGRRRRRQRQPRASLGRTPSAGRQPGFPAPRRRPEPPAPEQGLER